MGVAAQVIEDLLWGSEGFFRIDDPVCVAEPRSWGWELLRKDSRPLFSIPSACKDLIPLRFWLSCLAGNSDPSGLWTSISHHDIEFHGLANSEARIRLISDRRM